MPTIQQQIDALLNTASDGSFVLIKKEGTNIYAACTDQMPVEVKEGLTMVWWAYTMENPTLAPLADIPDTSAPAQPAIPAEITAVVGAAVKQMNQQGDTTVQIPTCGRVIWFFPNQDAQTAAGKAAQKLAALVMVDADSLNVDLFAPNYGNCGLWRALATPHKSIAQPGQSYWTWPGEQ